MRVANSSVFLLRSSRSYQLPYPLRTAAHKVLSSVSAVSTSLKIFNTDLAELSRLPNRSPHCDMRTFN